MLSASAAETIYAHPGNGAVSGSLFQSALMQEAQHNPVLQIDRSRVSYKSLPYVVLRDAAWSYTTLPDAILPYTVLPYTDLPDTDLPDTVLPIKSKPRLWLVGSGHAILWATTFAALNNAWYRDYPRSSFHFFDDRREWKQMDKAGHVWTAYQLSRHSAEAWRWAGISNRQAAWFGGASAFAFQSIIEVLDGFSEEWGFSLGDMEANLIGSGGYIAQQLLFRNQVLQVKLGYKPYSYPGDLQPRRNQLFGSTLPEQILKDYNSQRYWLSANLKSISGAAGVPAWLNLAIGYSADGIFGGRTNQWTDKQGNSFNRNDIPRVRRFYLSPDLDLTKIKTKRRFLRSAFFILNMVKIPAPAIEYNTKGKLKLHVLLF